MKPLWQFSLNDLVDAMRTCREPAKSYIKSVVVMHQSNQRQDRHWETREEVKGTLQGQSTLLSSQLQLH